MGLQKKDDFMNGKRTISVMLAGFMAVGLLTGCGNGTSSSAASSADSGATGSEVSANQTSSTSVSASWKRYDGVKISMMVDTDTSQDGVKAVLKLAKEKLGIETTMETRVGGTEGDNLMKTRLASGEMSDVTLYNSGSLLTALNPAEYFVDLTNQDFVATYDDTYKSTVTVGGKVYGVPFENTQVGAVMYNKSDYKKLGLEVPKTWDKFLSNCKALKNAGKTALIGTFGDSWTSQVLFLGDNYNIIASNKNFATDFTKGKTKFASTKEGVESFQKYLDVKDYYNDDYLSAKYEDGVEMLATGKGSQWIMLTQALGNIEKDYPDMMKNIGIFAIPGESADSNGITVWYPGSWYVNKNAKNQDACIELMKFWVSQEGIDAYNGARMPSGPSCIKGVKLASDVPEAVSTDLQQYFDDGKTIPALEFLTPVKGPNCMQITVEVGSGQTTAKEAAQKYDDDCKKQAVQLGLNW